MYGCALSDSCDFGLLGTEECQGQVGALDLAEPLPSLGALATGEQVCLKFAAHRS